MLADSFTPTFLGFVALNMVVLANAALISLCLLKFKVESWGKFILSAFLLFILQIFLSQIILGVFSVLTYTNIWIINLLFFASTILLLGKRVYKKTTFPPPPRINLSWFLILFSLSLALFLIRYFYALFQIPLEYDTIAYHLPFVVEWYKSGSLLPLYYNAFAGPLAYYPSNFELLELWAFLPFGNDLFINFINFFLYPILIISAYCTLRNFNIGSKISWIGVIFLVSMPTFAHFLGFSHVDLFFTVTFIVAIYFLQEFFQTKHLADLILAATSMGLFVGTKYLGIPYSFPLYLAAIILILKSLPKKGKIARVFAALGGLAGFSLLGGGFWYIRNWINSGNPIFPTEVSLGSYKIFDGYYGLTERIFKFSLSYNIHDLSRLKEFLAGFFVKVGVQTWLIPVFAVLAVIFIFKWINKKNDSKEANDLLTVLILLASTIFYFYFYWKAPYTYDNLIPNVRYAVIFLVSATLLVAFLVNKIKILRPFIFSLLPIVILYNLLFLIIHPRGDVAVMEGDKIPLDFGFIHNNFKYFSLYVFFLLSFIALVYGAIRLLNSRRKKMLIMVLGTFLVVMISANSLFSISAEKREELKDFFYNKYYTIEPLQSLTIIRVADWFDHNFPNAKIAYTGFNFHYHLFGRNLQREVDYININECSGCRYVDFKDSPGSIRRDPDFNNWIKNLKAKDKQYLVTAPNVIGGVKSWEFEWAKENPNKFKLIFQAGDVYVYKINYT